MNKNYTRVEKYYVSISYILVKNVTQKTYVRETDLKCVSQNIVLRCSLIIGNYFKSIIMLKFNEDLKISNLPLDIYEDLITALNKEDSWKTLAQYVSEKFNFDRYYQTL